jgi:hypothetical protein
MFDKSAEGLCATWEGPFMDICTPGRYESMWLKIRLFSTFWWEKGKMGMENNQLLHYNHFLILAPVVMNLRVPRNVGNFLTRWKPVSFSRRTLFHGVSQQPCTSTKAHRSLLTVIWPHKIKSQMTNAVQLGCQAQTTMEAVQTWSSHFPRMALFTSPSLKICLCECPVQNSVTCFN